MTTDAATPGSGDALIITGFHRSGTSAAARLLNRAGLDLGGTLIGARASNPYGHFEDAAIVALHDRLLSDGGFDWRYDQDRPVPVNAEGLSSMAAAARPGRWGFKDPRACFFLDGWTGALGGFSLVAVIRHPAAAVASLRRRELRLDPAGPFRRDPDLALRMWVAANALLKRYVEANPEAVQLVSFGRLLGGAPLVAVANERWDLGLDSVPTAAAVAPAYPGGPPPPLRSGDGRLVDRAESLWAQLSSMEEDMWTREAAGV